MFASRRNFPDPAADPGRTPGADAGASVLPFADLIGQADQVVE
jgi:hypothetical protein